MAEDVSRLQGAEKLQEDPIELGTPKITRQRQIPSPLAVRPGWFAVARQAFLWCLTVKLVWFVADPDFYFYIGDSDQYLMTAVDGHLPDSRSWVFGHLLGWLTLPAGNIYVLVVLQILALTLCGGILAGVGYAFLNVPRWCAVGLAMLAANSPLQLLYERTILTEAIGMLLFSLVLACALWAMCRRSYWALILVVTLGIVAVSLRLAFMPLMWMLAVLVPLAGWWGVRWGRMILALVVSLVLTAGLHTGYKHLTGKIYQRPAAYQYADGWFMLVSWIEGVDEEMAPEGNPIGEIIATSEVPFIETKRAAHMWQAEGIRARTFKALGEDISAADDAASATALNILKNKPSYVLAEKPQRIGRQFFTKAGIEKVLREDLNSMFSTDSSADLKDAYVERLDEHFHVARMDEIVRRQGPVKQWFIKAAPWVAGGHFFVPVVLLIAVSLLSLRDRWILYRALAVLAVVGLAYLAMVLIMAIESSYRLMMPLEPLAAIGLMALAGVVLREAEIARSGSESS